MTESDCFLTAQRTKWPPIGTPRKRPEEPMGTSISFKRPDGKDASGYLINAERGNAPAVVVIQEW